jgi:hypothetical protein
MEMIKRFLTIKNVKDLLNGGKLLQDIFKADALIFLDNKSTEIFNMYQKGLNEKEVINQIKDWKI